MPLSIEGDHHFHCEIQFNEGQPVPVSRFPSASIGYLIWNLLMNVILQLKCWR